MGAGLMSEMVLKEYAHRPTNILGTWDAGSSHSVDPCQIARLFHDGTDNGALYGI
jgi:hypothetical protein